MQKTSVLDILNIENSSAKDLNVLEYLQQKNAINPQNLEKISKSIDEKGIAILQRKSFNQIMNNFCFDFSLILKKFVKDFLYFGFYLVLFWYLVFFIGSFSKLKTEFYFLGGAIFVIFLFFVYDLVKFRKNIKKVLQVYIDSSLVITKDLIYSNGKIFSPKNTKQFDEFLEYQTNIGKIDQHRLTNNFDIYYFKQIDGYYYNLNFEFINEYDISLKSKNFYDLLAYKIFEKYSNNFEFDKKLSNFIYIIQNFDSLEKVYSSSKNMISNFENNILSIENYCTNIAKGIEYSNKIFENLDQTSNILSFETKQKIFQQTKFLISSIINEWKILLENFLNQINSILNLNSQDPNILLLKNRILETKNGLDFSVSKLGQLQNLYNQ